MKRAIAIDQGNAQSKNNQEIALEPNPRVSTYLSMLSPESVKHRAVPAPAAQKN